MRSIEALRESIRRLERPVARHAGMLAFGVPEIDAHLPERGLACAALHEIGGGTACVTLFTAGILGRLQNPVLWCVQRNGLFGDVFAPGLAGAGLPPDRVIYAEAADDKTVFLVMEEALRHSGLSAVVGEVGKLPMTASRRLVLAAEKSGVMGIALRRGEEGGPNAACTRWWVSPYPSPPLPVAGLGRARWQVELTRCRGGEPKTWILEACDAQGGLGVPAILGDGEALRAA